MRFGISKLVCHCARSPEAVDRFCEDLSKFSDFYEMFSLRSGPTLMSGSLERHVIK
jgi:hypothetical protein